MNARQAAERIVDELMAMGLRFPPFTVSRDHVVNSIASTIDAATREREAEITKLRADLEHMAINAGHDSCAAIALENAKLRERLRNTKSTS